MKKAKRRVKKIKKRAQDIHDRMDALVSELRNVQSQLQHWVGNVRALQNSLDKHLRELEKEEATSSDKSKADET